MASSIVNYINVSKYYRKKMLVITIEKLVCVDGNSNRRKMYGCWRRVINGDINLGSMCPFRLEAVIFNEAEDTICT